MLIVVCGSRTWTDAEAIRARLAQLPADTAVIHGGAHGADTLAARVAEDMGLRVRPAFLPDWQRWGRAAGIMRNIAMLDEGPDLVLAFHRGDSPGTRHTVMEARRRGIPVEVVRG